MLEIKDLEMLRNIIKEEIGGSEDRILANVREELRKGENLILEEMDKMQINFVKKIDELHRNLDELNQYYRITKLENDNTALLLKMVEELSRRITELEKKTA